MRLIQIRHLLATVDSGSIRGAARALKVASPALMRNLRELEQELGLKLLDRTRHGVVPTAAGNAFLARARIIDSELERIKEESVQLAGRVGILSCGISPAASPVLPGALATMRRQYPETEIRLVSGVYPTLLPQLRDGRIELAVMFAGELRRDKQFRVYPLFRSETIVAARRGHPLSKARSLEDLMHADWLLQSAPGEKADKLEHGTAGMFNRTFALFEENSLAPPRSVVRGDGGTYLNLLAGTDMIGIANGWQVRHGPMRALLQELKIKERMPASFTHTVSLLHKTDSPLTPVAAAMVVAVKAEARKISFAKTNK